MFRTRGYLPHFLQMQKKHKNLQPLSFLCGVNTYRLEISSRHFLQISHLFGDMCLILPNRLVLSKICVAFDKHSIRIRQKQKTASAERSLASHLQQPLQPRSFQSSAVRSGGGGEDRNGENFPYNSSHNTPSERHISGRVPKTHRTKRSP
jgi:hypothetical protein